MPATFNYQLDNKGRVQRESGRPTLHPEGELKLPCGKCDECISNRALQWAQRAKHEISTHTDNCFITLTYSDDNRPDRITKEDFKKFIKRLRKKYRLENKLRYMVSYEYGTKNNNIHMHAILFGFNFKHQKIQNHNNGNPLFTSKDLDALWKHGYHSIAEANEKTAYYIASYALKGNDKEVIDEETGEVSQYRDCMDVSKRPAIGLKYFLKNAEQIVTSGSVPRYYAKKLDSPDWCLERFPEYAKQIDKFPELLELYEERKWENLKDRSDHEKYSNFIINNQKNNCQSTNYRGYNSSNKKNNRTIQEAAILKRHYKQNRDNYVSRSGESHD